MAKRLKTITAGRLVSGVWMRHDGFPWEVDAWMPMPDRRPPEGEEDI